MSQGEPLVPPVEANVSHLKWLCVRIAAFLPFLLFFSLSRPESRSHMCLTARRDCFDSVFCNVWWWDGASRDGTMSSTVYDSLQGRKYGRGSMLSGDKAISRGPSLSILTADTQFGTGACQNFAGSSSPQPLQRSGATLVGGREV